MQIAKDYHKNSKVNTGKPEIKHQESTKVIPTSSILPLLKKSFYSEKWKSDNKGVLFNCPQNFCKCPFTVSIADLESKIIVCPKGHNICSEVIIRFLCYIFHQKVFGAFTFPNFL